MGVCVLFKCSEFECLAAEGYETDERSSLGNAAERARWAMQRGGVGAAVEKAKEMRKAHAGFFGHRKRASKRAAFVRKPGGRWFKSIPRNQKNAGTLWVSAFFSSAVSLNVSPQRVMRPTSVARWATPPSAPGGRCREAGLAQRSKKPRKGARRPQAFSGTARVAKR